MSKSLGFSYTDTTFGSPATLNLVRTNLNFGADFVEKERKSGESKITNITAANDQPEQIRIAYAPVKDVYANSGIDPAYHAPSKKGFSLVVQLTTVGRVTESIDGSVYDVPFSMHLVVKGPNDALVTSSVIEDQLKRLMSALYLENETGTDRLDQLIKGAVTPPEV